MIQKVFYEYGIDDTKMMLRWITAIRYYWVDNIAYQNCYERDRNSFNLTFMNIFGLLNETDWQNVIRRNIMSWYDEIATKSNSQFKPFLI